MKTLDERIAEIGKRIAEQDNRSTAEPVFMVQQKFEVGSASEFEPEMVLWENVTACFSLRGAEDYILANGHHLIEPRIYVDSAYGNQEWIDIRHYLMAKGAQS